MVEEHAKRFPFLIGNLIYTAERKLIGIYVTASNKPGTLLDILRVLSRYNVNVLVINFSPIPKAREEGGIFIIADFSDARISPGGLAGEIASLEDVTHVEIAEPRHPGMIVDEYHFPIVDGEGRRYILFTKSNMESLVVNVRREFGVAGLAFLYHQGRATGRKIAVRYKQIGIRNLYSALETLILHSTAIGRFRGEIVRFTLGDEVLEDAIVIRLHDNWECEVARENGLKEAASHFERGVIAGLVEAYTERKVSAKEIKCIALEDPYCEIKVTFPK